MMNCLGNLVRSAVRPALFGGNVCSMPSLISMIPLFPATKAGFSSVCLRFPAKPSLLVPPAPITTIQVAGFKVRHKLKKRCKDCYFVFRQERMMVLCATHPRHKQITPLRRPKYTWIISHATQSPVRPW